MADEISVDTEGLARVVPEVEALARIFQDIARTVESAARMSWAYGDDATARSAKKQNEDTTQLLIESLNVLGDVLKGTATGIDTTVAGLTRTEQLSSDVSTDVNRRMRG